MSLVAVVVRLLDSLKISRLVTASVTTRPMMTATISSMSVTPR